MSLITTIAEFKKYNPVDGNMKFATLKPFVDEAEQLYLVPLLGAAFYAQFHAAYLASVGESPTPLSADNAALLPYVQRPLAYYAQMLAIPHLTVTFGDRGIMQNRGSDSDPAPRWKEDKLLFSALKNADTHADKLLEFLEANATVSKYGAWFADMAANTRMSGAIVYSTAIASKHIAINNSRRVFIRLKPAIRDIEKRIVPRLISQAQYDELVTQLQTGTVTGNNGKLIAKIEPLVAKMALYNQLPYLRIGVLDDGLWLYTGTDELRKRDFLASDAELRTLRHELKEGDFGYLEDERELEAFIQANINDYPLIKASPVYTVQPDPGPTFVPRNDPNNKHFIV